MLITINPTPALADRVDAALAALGRDAGTHVSDVRELLATLETARSVTAVLVGPDVPLAEAPTLAHACHDLHPNVPLVLVSEATTDTLRLALRAGYADVLGPHLAAEELAAVLDGVSAGHEAADDLPGGTIVVFSAKGGVGTSVVASNLALALAGVQDQRVGLVDLDLPSADLAAMLGLRPRHTVVDVATQGTGADALEAVLLPINDSEVRVLPGPLDPAAGEAVGPDDVRRLLRALREVTPAVVVDTASAYDDATLAVLEHADAIVLPVGLDVLALRSLRVTIQTFDALGIDRDRLHVVVVRADAKVGLTVDDVTRTCGIEVAAAIPSSRDVVRSINTATPLGVDRPRHAVVKAIVGLAERLVDSGALGAVGEAPAARAARPDATTDATPAEATAAREPQPVAEEAPQPVRSGARPAAAAVRDVLSVTVDDGVEDDDPLAAMPPPTIRTVTTTDDQPRRRSVVRRARPARS